ncbi:peptidylprolyl isomerase [Lysobacter sp.]|uniref:peptidylprolyl isomerase n=1 Tax=Lysobacter sp. TaxID=72226 RepID=UPI002D272022|nr:peptidylprolyl isomerase [Lysobacter sp.]HZX75773.1 peptidylprolyl isomerase [Lysobacter sp.]
MAPRAIPLSMMGAPDATTAAVSALADASAAAATVWVGEEAIREAEIAREMQHHPSADPHHARSEAARALVVRRLLQREAEADELASSVRLHAGETPEEACIRALVQRQLESVPPPDDATCRNYYERNRGALRRPDRARLRHILLAAQPDDPRDREGARCLAGTLLEELRCTPAAFSGLARHHSACPSRENGGDLGWITRGSTTPEFERRVFSLAPGLAQDAIESRYGFHVVLVEELLHGEALTFEDAHPLIRSHLEKTAAQAALHRYVATLFERHGVRGLEHRGAPA